jgi:cytidylate kinase
MDREILVAIAKDFGVQSKVIELLDENARSELESWFGGMITGRIIDRSDYLKSLVKTLGAIANYGEMIIIGRGAHIILGPNRAFRVRIVASLENRVMRIAERKNISRTEAEKIITDSDETRSKFQKKSFGVNSDDASNYDLVINTDILDIADAVELAMLGYSKKRKYLLK